MRSSLGVVVALLAVLALVTVPVGEAPAESGTLRSLGEGTEPVPGEDGVAREEARIVGAYPNPVAHDDAGEFVLLRFPARTNLSGWTLSDGESTVGMPGRNVSGTIAVSSDPAAARNRTDHVVVGVGHLALANGGERLELAYRGTVVDALEYEGAPEGELFRDERFRHRLATNRSPVTTPVGTVRAFVLPDAPEVPVSVLRGARDRILLAGYSLTDERVGRVLRRAVGRGVEVRVLVDASPVGGVARREVRLLDSLSDAGIDVRVVGGDHSPYAFHHPKYVVVDDRALVTTENWKPAGTGGRSSRGWGVVLHDGTVADELAAVFRADGRPGVAVRWQEYRAEVSTTTREPANGTYPRRFESRRLEAERVRVLVAPDNAETELVRELRTADRSIRIQQMSMDRGPLLNATLSAARRGVSVRILLSQAWYVREENRRLVEWLRDLAARQGLDLEAKLVEPRSRYGKVHAKGAVIDDDRVVVGSLNWNHRSATRNREVVVVLEGEAVGSYYGRVFRADWRGGAWRLPAGVTVVLAALVVVAGVVGIRRVGFETERDPEEPSGEVYGW